MNGFLAEWWHSRPTQRRWWRILTLAIFGAIAGLALASWLPGTQSLSDRYRWSASQAIAAGDWETADLWLTKISQLEPDEERLSFLTALIAEQRGDLGQARPVMERHAQSKYSEIRGAVGLWMAHDILRHPDQLNFEGLNLARDLLIVARRSADPDPDLGPLGKVAADAGFSVDAARTVDGLVPGMDELRIRLAERYLPAQKPPGDDEKPAAAAPPPLGSPQYYLRLAESHVLLQSWNDAEQVLLQGLHEHPDPRLKEALAELYVMMSLDLEKSGRMPLPEIIRLLQRSFSLAPLNPMVLDRLAMLLRAGVKYPDPVMERLGEHIRKRLNEDPASAAWRTALGQLRILSGVKDIRGDCPESFLEEYPEARVTFAKLYRQRGEEEKCLAHARIAEDAFRNRLSENSEAASDRISLSECLVLMDRWKDAVDVLKIRGVTPQSAEMRTALANVYLAWAAETPDIAERVDLLLNAWEMMPSEPTIIVRMLDLTRLPSDLSKTVLTKLQDVSQERRYASLAALVLGSVAASRENYLEAQPLLELAYRNLPEEPILLNNLAWILIRGDHRDAPRALKLINRAMNNAPSTPELRETRCHVLFELRHWNEAIQDLEIVLPMFPDRPELHAMLARAYAEVGKKELAFHHRQLATQKQPDRQPAKSPSSAGQSAELDSLEPQPADASDPS